jgi:hypothetical protein
MNDVAEQCNPMAHERFRAEANKIPHPNAWHGIKFENVVNMQTIRIRTSFSKELVLKKFTAKSSKLNQLAFDENIKTLLPFN